MVGKGALSINNDNFACSNRRRRGIELERISSGLLLTSMRIKAVRASNSDSGGRRRRRGGAKWGGESWEGGGEPLMMSL